MNTFALFSDLLSYFIHPHYKQTNESIPSRKKFLLTLIILFWTFALLLFFFLLDVFVIKNDTTNKVDSFLHSGNTLEILILSIFILPLIEECTFRLSLRFKPIFLALTCFFIQVILINSLVIKQDSLYLQLLSAATVIATILYFLFRFTAKSILVIYEKYFPYIFYISAISFGLAHLTNYTQSSLVLPILVLPQTVTGFTFGYVRLRFGFLYSYFSHASYNSCLVIPVLIYQLNNKALTIIAVFFILFILIAGIWGMVSLIKNTILYTQVKQQP